MINFNPYRAQLTDARAQRDAAAAQLATLQAQLRNLQQQISVAQRLGGAQDERLAELQKRAQALTSQIDGQRQTLSGLQARAAQLLGQLTALGDPVQQVAQLDDGIPILLLPARVEIRFHDGLNADGRPTPQLWVRIYPDTCQIDSFEALLTDSEVQNARAFWIAMWRAGGVEAQERGAWRALVGGGSGSGRAAYVIDQYAPTNAASKPTKTNAQDVVLVIVPQMTVSAAEQTAAFAYWTAVWKANGDPTQTQAALTALRAAVGSARADAIVVGFAPDPIGWDPPKPYTRAQVAVQCAVLELPPPPTTKQLSWTQSPKAVALPDRFVVLAYNGGVEVKRAIGNPVPDSLSTAPDPSLPAGQQIGVTNDDLQLNDDLKWLAEFEHAVAVGMGIKIDLTSVEARAGFDRLLVVGVRASSDEKTSQQLLETLIAHQYATPGGYSLVPQGSPAHNTGNDGAAYSWVDDADRAFDTVIKARDAYPETDDPLQRRDGQWLAEALGIDDAVVKRIPNAAGVDQLEARAMNVALWNGTLGYMLEEMLTPLFSRSDIAATRLFFTRFVSGRGALPSVRVRNQPYGILPVTAFSRYASTRPPRIFAGRLLQPALPQADYLQRLYSLLSRLDADWRGLSGSVAHVGQPGDPHQTLLDIVGLHSGSVEFHQRYAESLDQLYNKLSLEFGWLIAMLVVAGLELRSKDLLTSLGADPSAKPPILEKFFYGDEALLNGPLVDDSPLSETKPIRAYTADKKNYIEWLTSASLDAIRQQDFGGNAQPTALLYLMLRHAMMLGQWDAGLRFLEAHALVDPAVARAEPSFINVQAAPTLSESKFQPLYAPQPVVTGDNTTPLSEYVLRPIVLQNAPETEDLREIVAALTQLGQTPTARLERLFAEHVDCCSYRLDAWKSGIVASRLAEMRSPDEEKGPRRGIYLGAFGWLENVRPKTSRSTPVQLEGDLAETFQRPGDAPLAYDAQNAGYIHAPSLSQAATAAILKNAYRVNASPANPDAMAVNLSSDRVRRALAILEGLRNGQTLPALLGYRFERGLHDEHSLAEVDKFIYPLRQAFPLVANQLKSTQTDGTVDIQLLEARNVIDGVALVNRMRSTGNTTYPFGLAVGTGPGQVPPATAQEQAAIDIEADNLLNLYDALGDLVMAESVYQVVLGNFDRAAANTKAFNQGGHPPDVQVVNTPRTGISLTHRVALHLDASADPSVSPSAVPMTPRARSEAPLNLWLAGRMPHPKDVVVSVTYSSPALSSPKTIQVSQQKLELQPLDLLYLVNLDLDQAMAELDDRIVRTIRYGGDAHPDLAISIDYTKPVAGKVTFFELAALVRSLRAIVLKGRAIGPTDMTLPLESKSDDAVWDDAELSARIKAATVDLTTERDGLVALQSDASDLDTFAKKVSAAFLKVGLFGIPQTGTGHIHGDIRAIYDAVAGKVQSFVDRWNQRASDYDALLATWPTLVDDASKIALLRKAERLVAASTTAQPPSDPDVYKADVAAKKGSFDTHRSQLQALLSWSGDKLVDFVAAVAAMVPTVAVHDALPLEIDDQQAAITTLRATLVSRVTSLAADLTQRIADATTAMAAVASVAASQDRVQQLLAAAKRVLGDEIQLVPRFALAADRALEFANAWGGSDALLTDLKANGRRFPVDDWLYGVARVREKLAAWENATVLSEAFGANTADLTPVQLPYLANDRWTALEFDTSNAIQANRLLYTAHFAKPFDSSAEQCGLLVDEWPELVPGSDVVSGVTFHFDRPNSQPPQAMLLAVPPVLRGQWSFDDLVASLHETLDGAKARGVEPAQIDTTKYSQFLPATVMAVTLYQITIATNLALNNRIYDRIGSQ